MQIPHTHPLKTTTKHTCTETLQEPGTLLFLFPLTAAGLIRQVLAVGPAVTLQSGGDTVTRVTLEGSWATRLQLWRRARMVTSVVYDREYFISFVCNACSPQSRSSELSPQSLSWSQTQFPGMHCPSSHRCSLSEQGLGSMVQNHNNRDTYC